LELNEIRSIFDFVRTFSFVGDIGVDHTWWKARESPRRAKTFSFETTVLEQLQLFSLLIYILLRNHKSLTSSF
jgi:hypothetical protein